MKKDLKSYTEKELQQIVVDCGGKKFHANYIYSFIHEKQVQDINSITPLSAALRAKLDKEGYFISSLQIATVESDSDGTKKYLFETQDGNRFETVLLDDSGRKTICISSQIGCKMGCSFCATAGMGFVANLSAGEIVEQVYSVARIDGDISNIVFMGMGEPFDNYDNAIRAAQCLNNSKGLNVGARHITLSTCGLPEQIELFSQVEQQFRLAVSIHAGKDHTRKEIMPIAKTYSLREVFNALKTYYKITGRRVTLEYCMINGVNDAIDQAEWLIKYASAIKCNVNLIEFNPHPNCKYEASNHNTIKRFAETLERAGIETHIRFRRGRSIKAACGQLGAGWKPENKE